MIIAKEKERDNIAEYILYMWQMEDLVRGSEMNLDKVLSRIFSGDESKEQVKEYTLWFSNLIEEMQHEGLEDSGHVKGVKTYMTSLENLHKALITVYQDQEYVNAFKKASPFINDLKRKSGSVDMPETEVCLVGLYGFLMLKMAKKEISDETKEAMKEMGQLMAYLAKSFNKLKEGELQLPNRMRN